MRPRAAFTLVELVVCVAIAAVLVALLIPAVQKVREAAARLRCENNLHQIGVAAHGYHDSMKVFPPGMRYQGGQDPYIKMSWLTQLLPYVEQQSLWAVTLDAYRQSPSPLNNPPHVGLSTVIPTFVCPSDPEAGGPEFAPRDKITVAFTSYLGVEGSDLFSKDGILFLDSAVRAEDVTDGTSQTLLAGERPPSADFQFGWWYAGAGQVYTGSADMVLGVQERNVLPFSWAPCFPGPYHFSSGRASNQCDMFHFWSYHPGGASFLFADGSVRFLPYSAAPLLPALASRSGGETVKPLD
jgi:prepilin-type processing-associated H-X9-DG protein/prepilin-type N-terminal cleavage/methylation domain-containing protein